FVLRLLLDWKRQVDLSARSTDDHSIAQGLLDKFGGWLVGKFAPMALSGEEPPMQRWKRDQRQDRCH
ncbi:hypothetical protein N9M80_04445, partial [Flavobacteriales bacterium]|nr:hypothetical protein [Flavobacteriales bacterium]